ncbi:hypothetical protein N9250_02600 [bacterium]|nr:hypothetical protein [bacterium]
MKRCRIYPQSFVVNPYLVVLVFAQVICIDDGPADVKLPEVTAAIFSPTFPF